MAEVQHTPATRLSEDINDVLAAIRKLIAEDEAMLASREQSLVEDDSVVDEDAAEFLARRYGGDAALARRLALSSELLKAAEQGLLPDQDPAPVPDIAPAPAHPEPAEDMAPDMPPDAVLQAQPEKPNLVRKMAQIASAAPAAKVPPFPPAPDIGGASGTAQVPPLRLQPERRSPASASGWKFWQKPSASQPVVEEKPVLTERLPAASAGQDFSAVMDDSDDFAEAFDWKARMRPELIEPDIPVPAEVALADQSEDVALVEDAAEPDDLIATVASEAVAVQATEMVGAGLTGMSPEEEEQTIRELLRDMIQEELQGELGQRFSRNLRLVIRREVAAAIDDQLERM